MPSATVKLRHLLIADRNGADLTREFGHLRNKRVEVVRTPRHEKFCRSGLRVLNRPEHDIAEIQQPRALGDNTHAHTGVNERHDGMNLGQLLDVTWRNASLGEKISHQIAKIIRFIG